MVVVGLLLPPVRDGADHVVGRSHTVNLSSVLLVADVFSRLLDEGHARVGAWVAAVVVIRRISPAVGNRQSALVLVDEGTDALVVAVDADVGSLSEARGMSLRVAAVVLIGRPLSPIWNWANHVVGRS